MPLTDAAYQRVRNVHIASSTLVALIAVIHSASTWLLYRDWTPDAVWFLGTGLCLLLLAVLNLSHIGIEPCRMPTTRLVRISNWVFVVYAVSACVAIPEPQAYAMTAAMVVQAVVGRWTLPGPSHKSPEHQEPPPYR